MKKRLITWLAAGLLVVGTFGNAMADTISYSEEYTPGLDYLMVLGTITERKTWTFDITDNDGWSPGQLFNDGKITLILVDDKGNGDGGEKADFVFDGGSLITNANINGKPWSDGLTVDSSQFNDGIISATLTVTDGDFYFRSARLSVTSEFTPQISTDTLVLSNPVPEPATMLLFGTGLIGLAGISIRRKKK